VLEAGLRVSYEFVFLPRLKQKVDATVQLRVVGKPFASVTYSTIEKAVSSWLENYLAIELGSEIKYFGKSINIPMIQCACKLHFYTLALSRLNSFDNLHKASLPSHCVVSIGFSPVYTYLDLVNRCHAIESIGNQYTVAIYVELYAQVSYEIGNDWEVFSDQWLTAIQRDTFCAEALEFGYNPDYFFSLKLFFFGCVPIAVDTIEIAPMRNFKSDIHRRRFLEEFCCYKSRDN